MIVKTKILPPRRLPNLLRRRRLLDTLHRLVAHRLVLVVAPAGYGKTTLLANLAAELDDAICWYTVDILDEEIYRFVAHWIAAIAQRFPQFGAQSNVLLQAYAIGQASLDQLLTTIVNELYDTVDEDFVFIVDDYHLVDGAGEIGYFVSRFIQNSPPNCHVVLSSRKVLALPDLALLAARSQVAGIDYSDLTFSGTELCELVQQRFGYDVSADEALDLVNATEGWITGLLLATHKPISKKILPGRLTHSAGVDLYDYLAQQVLDQQPAYLREFLLRTAALEEYDADLCAALFDADWLPAGKTWQGLVDEVLAKGLFVLPVGDNGSWLRFHRLFQEFLLYRLQQEYADDEQIILHRLAAWNEQRGQWERAYHLYQRLQDEEAVSKLVITAGPPLLKAGRAQLLEKWTATVASARAPSILPSLYTPTTNDSQARCELMAIRGVALTQLGQVAEGSDLLDRAIAGLEDLSGPTFVRALAWRAVIFRLTGDYKEAISESERIIAMTREACEVKLEHLDICALTKKNIGLCYYMQGRMEDAIQSLQEAYACYEQAGDEIGASTVRMDIATAYMNMGKLELARKNFDLAATTWRQLEHRQQLALTLNNLGVLFHLQGDLAHGLEMLAEALRHARQTGYQRIEALLYASIGDLLTDLEYWEGAEKAYRRCYTIASELNSQYLQMYAHLQSAWLACLAQDAERTRRILNEEKRRNHAQGSDYEAALVQLTSGRHHLMQGQWMATFEELTAAHHHFDANNNPIDALTAQLWLAAAAHKLSDDARARSELDAALTQIFELESQYSMAVAAKPIAAVLTEIKLPKSRAPMQRRFLRLIQHWRLRLSATRRQVRHIQLDAISDLLAAPPTIQIRALGKTEISLNGQVITNSEWKTLVSRDMLFCLLAHDEGLTREDLGAIFWPEASPNQLKTRFKNAIYRLRNALDPNVILYEDNIYRFNGILDHDYDVEVFLNRIEQAQQAKDKQSKIAALNHALAIYGGQYCLDISDDWAWIERERLERIYRNGLQELGQILFDDGRFQQAMDICRTMLTQDDCWEDAHRLAMRIHAALGNRIAIARQYVQCQQALHREIDALPSPRTEKLYARLMG